MFSQLSLKAVCVSTCLVFLMLDMVDVVITSAGSAGYSLVQSNHIHNLSSKEQYARDCQGHLPTLSSQYINPHLPR